MNKTALVTGGSRGIGRGIALKLASQGYDVMINYMGNHAKANEVKQECMALGVKASVYSANVMMGSEVESLIRATVEQFQRIDVLVNNAGITKDNLILRMSEAEFNQVIDINLKGTFNCTKYASKIMFKQRAGKIINIASVSGVGGNIGQVNYAASKAGVIGLTKTVARELASRHICVNAVAPGYIETDMTEVLSDDIKSQVLNNIPLKRLGKPSDVANLVSFLASEEANYITGQVIHVDGGMIM